MGVEAKGVPYPVFDPAFIELGRNSFKGRAWLSFSLKLGNDMAGVTAVVLDEFLSLVVVGCHGNDFNSLVALVATGLCVLKAVHNFRNFVGRMPVVLCFPLFLLLEIAGSVSGGIEVVHPMALSTVAGCAAKLFDGVGGVQPHHELEVGVGFKGIGLIFKALLIDKSVASHASIYLGNLLEIAVVDEAV